MKFLPRHLGNKILSAAKHFKVILLLGARQTGKSTLLRHILPNVKMIVFDPVQDLYDVRKDPDKFLDLFPPPLILDEVQFVPELLSALKRRVDQKERTRRTRPGRNVQSGGQGFGPHGDRFTTWTSLARRRHSHRVSEHARCRSAVRNELPLSRQAAALHGRELYAHTSQPVSDPRRPGTRRVGMEQVHPRGAVHVRR